MPQALNEAALRALPDPGPVVMVNLVRFRERALDGAGSGWDAYLRYSRETMPLIRRRGGTVLWAGKPEAAAFGDFGDARWDYIVLVRYPTRAAFLDMTTSAEYAAANLHRENGVEDHLILATAETYAKVG